MVSTLLQFPSKKFRSGTGAPQLDRGEIDRCNMQALSCMASNRPESERLSQQSLAQAEAIDYVRGIAFARLNLASLVIYHREFDQADALCQPLVELYVPDWVAAQEEFLSLKRMQGNDLGGLVFSQRVLHLLIDDKGMAREAAYAVVQRNALKSWETGEGLRELLRADPENTLGDDDLDRAFDLGWYLRQVDHIYGRFGL